MAVFDKFKQWVEKAFENTQPNDEKVLDEQYQEQLDVEKPPEELFKQNILMGDTGRSEIVGNETASEDVLPIVDDNVPARNIEQDQVTSPEQSQNEINIPDFLKADNNFDLNDDINTVNVAQPFSNSVDSSSTSDPDAAQFNPTPISNDFVNSSSVGADSSSSSNPSDNIIPDPVPTSDLSPVYDSDTTANSVNESASVGDSVGVTAFADDADIGDDVTYSLSNNPGNAFAIDPATGEVTVNDPSALDFETNANMSIEVTATSDDGSSNSASFNIAVEDINEGAVVTTANVSGDEDSSISLNIQLSSVEQGAAVAIVISGVPTGAVLSAGIDNNDGSWTLDQSELSGLTITPPENSDSDFNLSVETTVTENGDTQTYSNTFNVEVDAVADGPIIVGPDSITHLQNPSVGFEGGLGNVDISGTVNNPNSFQGQTATEGSNFAQLLANGATEGAVESDLGLANGALDGLSPGNATDGSSMQTAIAVQEGDVITFDWNFYNAETTNDINNGFNDFAVVNINGTPQSLAQSSDVGSPGATGWQTFSITATEGGVLDLGFAMVNTNDQQVDSSLLIDNLQINGSFVDTSPVDLNLNISLADTDGSETLSIEISGVPTDASLTAGTNLGGGVWSVDQNDIDGLQLAPSATTSGTVSLTVTATSTEADGGDTSVVTHNLDVEFETLDGPIFGTTDDDKIAGTANDDVIVARDGDDMVAGGDGSDLIMGGDGNDMLMGDAGDDQIYGGDGNDNLNGGAGDDLLVGGAGDDVAVGGAGDDVYLFEALGGDDSFSGGAGGGWTDVIELDVDIASQPDPDNPWTITVDGNEVSYDVDQGYLDLGPDASGVISLDDGSEITFDGVEQIQW